MASGGGLGTPQHMSWGPHFSHSVRWTHQHCCSPQGTQGGLSWSSRVPASPSPCGRPPHPAGSRSPAPGGCTPAPGSGSAPAPPPAPAAAPSSPELRAGAALWGQTQQGRGQAKPGPLCEGTGRTTPSLQHQPIPRDPFYLPDPATAPTCAGSRRPSPPPAAASWLPPLPSAAGKRRDGYSRRSSRDHPMAGDTACGQVPGEPQHKSIPQTDRLTCLSSSSSWLRQLFMLSLSSSAKRSCSCWTWLSRVTSSRRRCSSARRRCTSSAWAAFSPESCSTSRCFSCAWGQRAEHVRQVAMNKDTSPHSSQQ